MDSQWTPGPPSLQLQPARTLLAPGGRSPLPKSAPHLLPANPSCRFHRLTAPVPADADPFFKWLPITQPIKGQRNPDQPLPVCFHFALLFLAVLLALLVKWEAKQSCFSSPPALSHPYLVLERVWTHLPASTSMALVLQPHLQIHAPPVGWVEPGPPLRLPRTLCRIEGLRVRDLQSTGGRGWGGWRGMGPVPTSERPVIEGHTVKGGAASG